MSVDVFAAVVLGALLLGFSAGLFLFRVKSRWCPECGAWTYTTRPAYPGRMVRHR